MTLEDVKRIKIEVCLGSFNSREITSTFLKDLDDLIQPNLIIYLAQKYYIHLCRDKRFETARKLYEFANAQNRLSITALEKLKANINYEHILHMVRTLEP